MSIYICRYLFKVESVKFYNVAYVVQLFSDAADDQMLLVILPCCV
jgi:hypothetical protein